jgi:fimbrial chaperone protein
MASGMRVSPLMLEFGAEKSSAMVKIFNGGTNKLMVQLEALSWSQGLDGQDQYEPTSDIVFFPRIFSVDPGGQRNIRVGFQGKPLTEGQKAYRLYVQELPVEEPGQVAMRFAVRMGIPVFASFGQPKTAWGIGEAGIDAHSIRVEVENSGNRFVRVSDIKIIGRGVGGGDLFTLSEAGWYVLAGRKRHFRLRLAEGACQQLASIELAVTSGNETRNKHVDQTGLACESGF